MESINQGLTWREIRTLFNADGTYGMLIRQRLRRTKKWKRKKGEAEDRKVVRLTIQRDFGSGTKTVFRKNLKGLDDGYLDQPAAEKVVDRINSIVEALGVV